MQYSRKADAPESMRTTNELRLAGDSRPVGGGLCYGGFAAVQRCGPSFIQAAGDWASAKQDGVVPEDCQGSDGRHGVGTEDAASRDIAIGRLRGDDNGLLVGQEPLLPWGDGALDRQCHPGSSLGGTCMP